MSHLNVNFETEILNLRVRMDGVEERLSRLETFKLEIAEKVARLERLQLQRQSVTLTTPGKRVSRLGRDKR